MTRKSILIVDDDAHIRKLAQVFLQRRGYHVMLVNDGQAALDLLETTLPQLIITDLHMPFVDGIELAHVVRSNQPTAHIPIILLSAHGEAIDLLQAHVDVNVCLKKPLEMSALAEIIETLLTNQSVSDNS